MGLLWADRFLFARPLRCVACAMRHAGTTYLRAPVNPPSQRGIQLPEIVIRPATPRDTAVFMSLLAMAGRSSLDPDPDARDILAAAHRRPMTHSMNVALTAELSDGMLAGALVGGPSGPLLTSRGMSDPALRSVLRPHISMVNAVAVHPDHRRRGIGSALIETTEKLASRASLKLIVLEHEPHNTEFYRRLGYTTVEGLVLDLPHAPVVLEDRSGLRLAFKALTSSIEVSSGGPTPYPTIKGIRPRGAQTPLRRFSPAD